MADAAFQLDDYQIEGADWLATTPRALLADVMGVGKSAQAVAAFDRVDARSINILCQGAKRLDWAKDIASWSTRSRPIRLIETGKDRPQVDGINICSYDLADILLDHVDMMDSTADALGIDEVQFLKTPGAKRTKTVLGRGGLAHFTARTWLLSGTPFLNHPAEMWPWLYSLFHPHFADLGRDPVANYEGFVARYCETRPCDYGQGVKIIGGRNLDELRTRMAPFTLRRGEEVIEMPSLAVEDMPIPRERITDTQDIRDLLEAENGPGGRALTAALEALAAGEEVDLGALRDSGGHIATLRKVTALAKTKAICEDIAAELTDGRMEKVVIFGVHRDSLNLAHAYLDAWGFGAELVWGGTSPKKRAQRLHRFATNYKHRVFVGQIDATGTGVDGLQHGACDAVFIDGSWTPGINAQAIKRLHRRGQRRPVRARFAALAGSIDEHVQRVNRRKAATLLQLFG